MRGSVCLLEVILIMSTTWIHDDLEVEEVGSGLGQGDICSCMNMNHVFYMRLVWALDAMLTMRDSGEGIKYCVAE